MSFDFSTLVTDRTQADVSRVKQIAEKIKNGTASESELAEFNSAAMKGAYNYTDLNRVTAAMEALKAKLEGYGYAVPGYQRIKVPHVLPEPEPTSRLPEGYTELAWIESTGTQYVDTGFKPNQNTRVVAKAICPVDGKANWLFGSRDSTSAGMYAFVARTGGFYSTYFGANVDSYDKSMNTSDTMTVDKNKAVTTLNGTSIAQAAATFQTSYSMTLFAVNTAGTVAYSDYIRVYSCQIYDNGTLVRDYVPCKNSGGVFGLYDLANDVFYQNAGTGTFAAGEEVVAPATASVMVASSDLTEYDPYTWYEFDWPTTETMTVYLLNVSAIRSVLAVLRSTPEVPTDMERLMTRDANDIEAILLDVYRQLTIMPTTFIPCGEALCGGDNL